MKNKIITLVFLLGAVTYSFAETPAIKVKSVEKNVKSSSFLKKFFCTIYTTVVIKDENNNVISTESFKTEGSGLQCVGADSDGIVRKTKRVTLEGTSTGLN